MPCPEACGAVWEEEDEAEDEAAEDEAAEDTATERAAAEMAAEDEAAEDTATERAAAEMAAKRVRHAEHERRSADSSATHSIAASPFHAIQSRSIWDGRMSGRRMRWAHDSLGLGLVPDTSSGGWLSGNTLSRIKYGNSSAAHSMAIHQQR